MRFPDTRRDVRWQNLNMFPICIMLFIFNIVNLGVTSAYIDYYTDPFSITIICTSIVTIIHSFVDILVVPHNKLSPIYVTIMSSFCTLFWTGGVIVSAVAMVFGIQGGICSPYYYDYYDYYSMHGYSSSGCPMLITSFVFSLFTLALYVSALCVGAIALGRFQKAALGRQRISYDVENYNRPNYSQRGLDDNLEISPIPPTRTMLPTNLAGKVELSA